MSQHPFPRFFRAVALSCTSPDFYKQIVVSRFWSSWKYFFCLHFLTTFATIVSLVITVWTFDLVGLLQNIHAGIADAYPQELVISVNKNGYSINQERPYSVPIPPAWAGALDSNAQEVVLQNIVVFETDETFTNIDQFWDYNAMVVITETKLYANENKNGYDKISVTPIDPKYFKELSSEIVVTKTMIDSIPTEKLTEYLLLHKSFYTPIIGAVAFIILYPLVIVGTIIQFFFSTLFIFLGFTIFASAKKLSFERTYQVVIHSSTLFILIKLLLSFVHIPLSSLVSFVGFVVWTSYLIASISPKKPVKSTAQPS